MSYTLDTIRLLIAHDSQDEAEQLINALRNAGKATRAELALSEDDFLRALKGGSWELVLCRPRLADVDYHGLLGHMHRLGRNLPTLVLADTFDAATVRECMTAGARAAVPANDRELLMLFIDRQIEQLRLRRELQHSQLALHQAEKRLATLLDQSRDAIAYVVDGMHIHANDAYLEMFGYESVDDLAGVPIMDMVSSEDHQALKKLLKSRAQDETQTHDLECKGVDLKGNQFDATFVFSASTFDGEACTQIVIRSTAVDESVLQEKLQEISQTDQVTGLHNRGWFTDRLESALEEAVKSGSSSAVFLVRIDGFEQHQTAIGVDGADELLREIGGYLTRSIGDKGAVARISGEDFGILMPANDRDTALADAERLRKGIADMLPVIASKTIQLTASIGVSLLRDDSRSAQSVLTKALECCNAASRDNGGKGNAVHVHNPLDDVEAGSSEAIAMVLRDALEKGRLRLQYQPFMNLNNEGSHQFEVYVDLPQENGEALTPSQFMPVAAELGLAGKIDRWVILNAIKAAAPLNVSLLINLHGHSLEDPALADWIGKAVKAAKIDPAKITFQFREQDLTNYLTVAALFSDKIHQLGCRLSVSQFGGALDPFKVIGHIKLDMVKFDRSYTQDVNVNESRGKFAELIERVGANGLEVMVGFVESAGQMQTLWTLGGVHYLQGFYLQTPSDRIQVDDE